MTFSPMVRSVSFTGGLSLLLAFSTGCSTNFAPSHVTSSTPTPAITGTVFGGQQPIVGAKIYMYAAASAPLVGGVFTPPAARSMLTTTGGYITTGAGGSFSLASDFTCQTGDQVYLLAVGGDPGIYTAANAAITLAAPLGDCSKLNSSTKIKINEATTVAMAYALGQFMSSPTTLGSTGTTQGSLGLANAFLTAANFLNLSTGGILATTASGTGTVPQDLVDALANSIAACVNSNGGSTSVCPSLFTNATPTGGTTPTDTFTAALNIVHHPATNVTAIFNLAGSYVPFQPTLSAAPHDWSLAIDYTDSKSDFMPQGAPAIDSQGRVWLPAATYLTLISPVGASSSQFFPGSTVSPLAVAVDTGDHLWFMNSTTLIETNSAGTNLMQKSISVPSQYPVDGLSFDASNRLWLGVGGTNLNTSTVMHIYNPTTLAELSPSGGYVFSERNGVSGPVGRFVHSLADTAGDMWYGTQLFSSTGTLLATNSGTANFCGGFYYYTASFDRNGVLWGPDAATSNLVQCDASGTTQATYSLNGLSGSANIVIDGDNHIWMSSRNAGAPQLVEVDSADGSLLTPTYLTSDARPFSGSSGTGSPYGMAADASGNMWVAGYSHLQEFVGLVAPVITPVAAAVQANAYGTRP